MYRHINARAFGIQAGGRLVEEQHLRVVEQAHGDVEPPHHSARVVLTRRSAASSSSKRVSAEAIRPFEVAAGDPVKLALKHEVLSPRRVRVGAMLLADHADHVPELNRMLQNVDARDRCAATVRARERAKHPFSVDFPAPFGPSTPKMVPASTATLMPSRACTAGGSVFERRSPQSPWKSCLLLKDGQRGSHSRGRRIELAGDHTLEQPLKRGILGTASQARVAGAESRARAPRCAGSDGGLGERTPGLDVRAVPIERGEQLVDAVAGGRPRGGSPAPASPPSVQARATPLMSRTIVSASG